MRNVLLSTLQTLLNKIITFDFFFHFQKNKNFKWRSKKNHNKVQRFQFCFLTIQVYFLCIWAHLASMLRIRVWQETWIWRSIMNSFMNCMNSSMNCKNSSVNCLIRIMRNVLLSTLQTILNKIITFDFFFWKKIFWHFEKKNHNKVHGF